jgi:hypothetical protein
VLDVSEAGFAAQREHLGRREEADAGCAACARPLRRSLDAWTASGSASSIGNENDMANVEPGASAAT